MWDNLHKRSVKGPKRPHLRALLSRHHFSQKTSIRKRENLWTRSSKEREFTIHVWLSQFLVCACAAPTHSACTNHEKTLKTWIFKENSLLGGIREATPIGLYQRRYNISSVVFTFAPFAGPSGPLWGWGWRFRFRDLLWARLGRRVCSIGTRMCAYLKNFLLNLIFILIIFAPSFCSANFKTRVCHTPNHVQLKNFPILNPTLR